MTGSQKNTLQLKEVQGIGPAAVKKLKDAGIETVENLATQNIESLKESVGLSTEKAIEYINNAHELMRKNDIIESVFIDGNQALNKREKVQRISTGSPKLDGFLYGGIETGAITELYGEFGSGKSQICHVMAINVQKLPTKGKCIYIDTEGTFRPERIKQICQEQGLNESDILADIKICRVYSSGGLEEIMKSLPKYVEEWGIKMIIVDSIIALHRADYLGRGTLADRQQKIQTIMHKLLRIAEIYNLAVIITNQVITAPDTFFGDPTKPTGGNMIGHAATYRIYLRKSGKNRLVKMIDSPYHDSVDVKIEITTSGIQDAQE